MGTFTPEITFGNSDSAAGKAFQITSIVIQGGVVGLNLRFVF